MPRMGGSMRRRLPLFSFTFDTDLNGFDIDPNPTTNPVNLGAIAADGGAPVTATFDGSVGMPAPGSAHITATFSDYNQVVAFRHVYANNTQMVDLTGATLTARVRLDPGADGGATTSPVASRASTRCRRRRRPGSIWRRAARWR